MTRRLSSPLSNADVRTGTQAEALRHAAADHLRYSVGRLPEGATAHDYYRSLALAVRDRMQDRWAGTTEAYIHAGSKFACYLSA